MSRLRIATRVSLLAALMMMLALAMGTLGLWGISRSNAALQTLHTERLWWKNSPRPRTACRNRPTRRWMRWRSSPSKRMKHS